MRSVPFARIDCHGNELRYLQDVLESGWLTTAAKAQTFERRFAEQVGAKHACAVNSCTAALHLALEAINVGPGDKVLVPTMTFTATAEVVRYLGADPVFLDVEYGSALLTPDICRAAIRAYPEAKALIVVHFGGQPAEMLRADGQGITDLCRRHGIRVVEDAAHAFPAIQGSRPVGGLGDAACFSFYANKTITTGEGGMLTTDNDEIAKRVRVMRLHGIDRDVWHRHSRRGSQWEYDVVAPGFKYNMPDVNAAIGLAQLERAAAMRKERQRCALRYLERLTRLPALDLPLLRSPVEHHAWHLFCVVLRRGAAEARNRLIERLARRGVGTSVHYKPLHRMTYYRNRYRLEPGMFPEAERMWQGCFSLPIYATLTDDDVDYVCDQLEAALAAEAPAADR